MVRREAADAFVGLFIDSGFTDEFMVDDGASFGKIGCDGTMLSNWNERGDRVIVAAVVVVVTAAAAVTAGRTDGCWGIFLVALIGLESTGAHSEAANHHINQTVSIKVNVNTEFGIVLSFGRRCSRRKHSAYATVST